MMAMGALFMIFAGVCVLFLAFALVAVVLKLVFRIVLFPLFLGLGLLKLILLPVVAIVGLAVAMVVGPVLLALGAVFLLPLLLLGGLLWTGIHVASHS
jgi:hypothetical protein